MKDTRPINIDPRKYKFPPMAIASILHRITGILIFLGLPILLYLLYRSLVSEHSFQLTQSICLAHPLMRIILWVVISATVFHLFAGLRHIIMDMGCGESLKAARFSAWLVMIAGAVAAILVGVWLW